jgi:hypothetical protein
MNVDGGPQLLTVKRMSAICCAYGSKHLKFHVDEKVALVTSSLLRRERSH